MAELADAYGSGPYEGSFMEVRVLLPAPNHENPDLFSIGEGFGFFVFFGNDNSGSFPTAVCPKPYQKKTCNESHNCKGAVRQKGHEYEVR